MDTTLIVKHLDNIDSRLLTIAMVLFVFLGTQCNNEGNSREQTRQADALTRLADVAEWDCRPEPTNHVETTP